MRYAEARPRIQSGDLIAFKHEGWGSLKDIECQIIRIATRSEYSHVGIAWPVAGRVMILEAVVPMIRIFPLSKLLPFYWISLGKPLTPKAEEFALSRIGDEYSKLEAIRGYFGFTEVNQKWECAEYARSVLNTSGWSFCGKDIPSNLVYEALWQNGILNLVTE
jgi:hypothetical protein